MNFQYWSINAHSTPETRESLRIKHSWRRKELVLARDRLMVEHAVVKVS